MRGRISTKLIKISLLAARLHFQGYEVKGHGSKISDGRRHLVKLIARKPPMDLNQNLHRYLLNLGEELIRFQGQRSNVNVIITRQINLT